MALVLCLVVSRCLVWGQPPSAVQPSEARQAFALQSSPLSSGHLATVDLPRGGECPRPTGGPTPQTLSESNPPPPGSPLHNSSPENPEADNPAPPAPLPAPSRRPEITAGPIPPRPQSATA